jgi:hypothetical protein
MDFETPDGSQFSLRGVYRPGKDGLGDEEYTSVSTCVDGVAYTGRINRRMEDVDVDDADLFDSLERVPPECIHPTFRSSFTKAPAFDRTLHYLKSPSFEYEDCRPGRTFVADCFLNEVKVLEKLKSNPHPNIAGYHGCVVKDGRITQVCLTRYPTNLADMIDTGLSDEQYEKIKHGLASGVQHLHSLGLAHNDINPGNVCIDVDGEPIIIDFDSCLPFGKPLLKGIGGDTSSQYPVSSKENDLLIGLAMVDDFMRECGCVEREDET